MDQQPAWPPDGSKLSFVSRRDNDPAEADPSGNPNIYVMDADGSGQRRLTCPPGAEFRPVWSPDGTRIVFKAVSPEADADIYVIGLDRSEQQRLTADPAEDRNPAWSPDGTKIVCASARDGNYDIYVMNPDGSEQNRITHTAIGEESPAWQPVPSGAVPFPEPTPVR